MWIPVLLKKIADIVRAETGAIQETIQHQDEAARSAYDETKSELRKVPWAAITSIILDTKNEREAAKSDRDKEHTQQDKLIFWTRLSVLVSIVILAVYLLTLLEVKRSADAAQYSAEVSDKSVLNAQRGERDSRLISEKQLAANHIQFEQTLEQMKGQTYAAKKAAATAQQALTVNLSEFRSKQGVPRVVVDPWVAWYYGSIWCKAGQVCTRLTIHNTVRETEATELKIAVKIALLPVPPRDYPHNWAPVPQSRLGFSPLDEKLDPGYPNCEACSTFWARQTLRRKVGAVYVWGMVSYTVYGGGDTQTSPFCFQATPDEIFRIASQRDGFGKIDTAHRCQINQPQPFPKH